MAGPYRVLALALISVSVVGCSSVKARILNERDLNVSLMPFGSTSVRLTNETDQTLDWVEFSLSGWVAGPVLTTWKTPLPRGPDYYSTSRFVMITTLEPQHSVDCRVEWGLFGTRNHPTVEVGVQDYGKGDYPGNVQTRVKGSSSVK